MCDTIFRLIVNAASQRATKQTNYETFNITDERIFLSVIMYVRTYNELGSFIVSATSKVSVYNVHESTGARLIREYLAINL